VQIVAILGSSGDIAGAVWHNLHLSQPARVHCHYSGADLDRPPLEEKVDHLPRAESDFGRLVTDLALPAMIFIGLARHSFQMSELVAVGIMAAALLLCMLLSWLAGRTLGLEAGQLGAFILAASFGSSSTLGYALISQAFPNDPTALAEAMSWTSACSYSQSELQWPYILARAKALG
jgi:Membrane transport protein